MIATVGICLFMAVTILFPTSSANAEKIKAFVSILPQAYCVERIGGPHVAVEVLVGPGQSPATYEPTPKQMARLGQSQVYFRIGTPFERGIIDRISKIFKHIRIIDTRKGISLRYFRLSKGISVADPHIWLNPMYIKIQAHTICRALITLDPAHEHLFRQNLERFQNDLDALDTTIAEILAPVRGQKFYVFHPAFGYFGDRYGLTQVAVEIEGKEPSPKQLARLIRAARENAVTVIFVQPQFAKREADAIARAIDGAVVPMDPLARNYMDNMKKMARTLHEALVTP